MKNLSPGLMHKEKNLTSFWYFFEMTNMFSDKKILVAGGTGLVGQQLVPKLINLGGKVFVASLDDKSLVSDKIEERLENNVEISKWNWK